MTPVTQPCLGVVPRPGGASSDASVWAPAARAVAVRASGGDLPLERDGATGLWRAEIPLRHGDRYEIVVDGTPWPDPWSRHQPDGVRAPSAVLDAARLPRTGAHRIPLAELVVYELHVGTFSEEGTFAGAAPHLAALRALGVTAIELMPVATFAGRFGWGYDVLYAFAPHEPYGGPEGLARLVAAAHDAGLAVLLDVVYNHLGPGNEALRAFGPFLTPELDATPWGEALDFRVPAVREWAIQNAEHWVTAYGVDGLRLDAVHATRDPSEDHVLAELGRRVKAVDEDVLVISEMGSDDPRPIREWGHDAMWADALHHALHVALTGERDGYYAPFDGSLARIADELLRPDAHRLVVCGQNHDQVGNRALGDRLPPAAARLAGACCLFSRSVPLLFQGEEYGERRPFPFFADHVDPSIADATREGRRREFADFEGFSADDLPDPLAPATFESARLDRSRRDEHTYALYNQILELRTTLPDTLTVDVDEEARHLVIGRGEARLVLDFDGLTVALTA